MQRLILIQKLRGLLLHGLLFLLQRGDDLLILPILRLQRSGDRLKISKRHLLATAILVPQPLQIPMYRSKIPARQIQTANDGRKQQQRRKQHRLHNIFGNSEIVILFRDQHRQRVGRSIALCRGKIFYHADKGKTVAVQGHKTVTHGFNGECFRRNIAEAFLRIGHQGRSRIQGITALRGQQAGEAAEVGGLVIARGKVGLIDGEAAHSIDRAVCPDHGDRQQNRLFRGSRQGDKVSGAAGIGNRGGSLYGMLRVIGELPNMEFLRPLPMRHDIVCFAHAGNAPEQQQVIGHTPRVCPLHVEAAADIRCIPVAHGALQDNERAGAVRLPDILAQRLQHSVLYRFGRLHIPVQILKGDALLLQRVLQQRDHILG